MLTILQVKAWTGLTSHDLPISVCHTGCQVPGNRGLCARPGNGGLRVFECPLMRGHLSTVQASGRTQCSEQMWALESRGPGCVSGHHRLTAVFSLTYDINLSKPQVPHLENGDNNPYLLDLCENSRQEVQSA